jgi:hypothetical protein
VLKAIASIHQSITITITIKALSSSSSLTSSSSCSRRGLAQGSAHGGLVRQGAVLSVVVMLALFVVSLLRRQGLVSALLGKHVKTHAS